MKTILLVLLRAYQLGISPYLGQNCRFYPSCSQYALEAVREHGALRGGFLMTRRLCKCHPWHPGGVDPVPEKATATSAQPARSWRPPLLKRDP
jgi:putative membrane protein insertion efficiency factor